MTAITAAGTTLAVSLDYPATISAYAFSELDFVSVGEVVDPGSIGRVYAPVQHSPVGNAATRKLKGSYDDGSMSVQLAYAPGDPGQAILASALDDDDPYPFALTMPDGSIKYFLAQILSAPVAPGSVDSIVSSTADLSIRSGTTINLLPLDLAGDFYFNNPSTVTFGAI